MNSCLSPAFLVVDFLFIVVLCFVVRDFMSILVLQSS